MLKKKYQKNTGVNKHMFDKMDALRVLVDVIDIEGDKEQHEEQQPHEEVAVFCLCKEPYDEDKDMIACDVCDEFYHITCIGMSRDTYLYYLDSDILWFCNGCE